MLQVAATMEFVRWRSSLDPQVRARIDVRVNYLRTKGKEASEPFVKPVVGSRYRMGELRYDDRQADLHLRVLFVYATETKAILLVGGDKTRNWRVWYDTNIIRAEALYEQYLREHLTEPHPRDGGREQS